MAGVFDETSRASWVWPAAGALALHVLLFGCLRAPQVVSAESPPTMEVSLDVLSPAAGASAAAAPIADEARGSVETSQKRVAAARSSSPRHVATKVSKIGDRFPSPLETQRDDAPAAPDPVTRQAHPPESSAQAEGSKASLHSDAVFGMAASHIAALAGSLTGTGPNASGNGGTRGHGLRGSGTERAGVPGVKPKLLSSGNVCLGLLPATALGAPEKLTLVVHVDKDGTATTRDVQANGDSVDTAVEQAARACARRLRFTPGRSPEGERIASSSVVRLTFTSPRTGASLSRQGHI